jgi:hypothetical protein
VFDFEAFFSPAALPEKQANSFAFLYVPVSGAPIVPSPKQPSYSADEAQNWLSHPAQPDLALNHVFIKHLDFVHIFLTFLAIRARVAAFWAKQRLRNVPFQHPLPHLSQPFMPDLPWLPTITTAIHTPTTSMSR